MVYYVEFYSRETGYLEHNDEYTCMEDAWKDAKGRLVIVTNVTWEK